MQFYICNGKPTVGDSGTDGVGRLVTQENLLLWIYIACEIHLVQIKQFLSLFLLPG